jgi:predicted alpha/beta superfamily hydrolase
MDTFDFENKVCWSEQFGQSESPLPAVILYAGDEVLEQMEHIEAYIMPLAAGHKCRPFLLAGFGPVNWDSDYSPWTADLGGRHFAGKGNETASFTMEKFIPEISRRYSISAEIYICGYSLGGLAALYAHCLFGFSGCASCSGSLWYPGWFEFLEAHIPNGRIYLSLGGKEEKTKDPYMSRVGEATQLTKNMIRSSADEAVYIREAGGHFKEVPERIARGILWLLK